MKKVIVLMVITAFVATGSYCYAGSKSSSDILKDSLLGAGAGAVGGLASGAKGKDVWKGALAGVGVNVVGGALLDSISGEHVEEDTRVRDMSTTNAFSQGYNEGYTNGFKQGYTQGYKDGIREAMMDFELRRKAENEAQD